MSFALVVYYSSDARQQLLRPKLLLLDEVDASLHPQMIKSLIATIQKVIVDQLGIKVIMTTHSPTTVALAPNEAIYVMKSGMSGPQKVSKDAALKQLTYGVPMVSLSYDGLRQIFVEGPVDASVYQCAFDALRDYIHNEITPMFISAGAEGRNGSHENTGCDSVTRIVTAMRQAGAHKTFGLIDWDGRNAEEEGIFVLCKNLRDGLESVIFDPLLLVNTLMQAGIKTPIELGLPLRCSYISMSGLAPAQLQMAANTIQSTILGKACEANTSTEYVGGFLLDADQEYLHLDDHELARRVEAYYPAVKQLSKGRSGGLLRWVSKTIIKDRPEHTPKCLLDLFIRLCES